MIVKIENEEEEENTTGWYADHTKTFCIIKISYLVFGVQRMSKLPWKWLWN